MNRRTIIIALAHLALLTSAAAAQSAGSAGAPPPAAAPSPAAASVETRVTTAINTVAPAVGCFECGMAVAPFVGAAAFQPEMLPVLAMPYSDGYAAQQIVQTCLSCGQWISGLAPTLGYPAPTATDVYLTPTLPPTFFPAPS